MWCVSQKVNPRDLIDNKCGTGYRPQKKRDIFTSNIKQLIGKYQQDVGLADIHADGGPR